MPVGSLLLSDRRKAREARDAHFIDLSPKGKVGGERPLDEADAVGNVKSVLVRSKTNESLLLAIGADQGVDLGSRNVVKLLESTLDLALVSGTVNDEDESVVLLDLLHGRLGVERVEDGAESIHARSVGDSLAGVLGRLGKVEGLGATESGVGADLADLGAGGTLKGGLLGGGGLDGLGLVGGGHLDERKG